MILFAIAFLVGDCYLQMFKHLPHFRYVVAVLIFVGAMHYLTKYGRRYTFALLALTLGILYSAWYVHQITAWELKHDAEGVPIAITGHVVSIPTMTINNTAFIFKLETLQNKPCHSLVYLSSRKISKRIMVGDKWHFIVNLRQVHGVLNPGGFDYEAWALQRGLRATGIIIEDKENKLLLHQWYLFPLDHLRQQIFNKLRRLLPHSKTSPWLLALIVGERQQVPKEHWEILRRTGTNHLMAIAGLHIGVIAGFAYGICSNLWRSSPLLLKYPSKLASGYCALIVGVFYSMLAGFSIPTQRACSMLCFFVAILILRRRSNPWVGWSHALLLVLFFNPLAVMTESFWLSFVTIALIIYGMRGRLSPTGWWWHWGRVQWVIALGLIPITLIFFQDFSLVGFIANCIAIPWLSFLVLPFCLLSVIFVNISSTVTHFLLILADKSLAGLWKVLMCFASMPVAVWEQAIDSWWLVLAMMIGVILLLLPRGTPGRWFGILWFLPLWYASPSIPGYGEYWLTLLDVGQGLSVIVRTHSHVLIFDTGARLSANYDMGKNVVLPYLVNQHIKKVDMLVISHGDNDHIGGSRALFNAISIHTLLTSVPGKLTPRKSLICSAGMEWYWDNVKFKVLHPGPHQLNLGNNSSCVLRVDNGVNSALITGDIEKPAEKTLLSSYYDDLHASILIAPHHGSKTSGLPAFVSAVNPRYVLYATGYMNRYHFPHESVVQEYKKINSIQLNTAKVGAIMFKIPHISGVIEPFVHRNNHLGYLTNLTSPEF